MESGRARPSGLAAPARFPRGLLRRARPPSSPKSRKRRPARACSRRHFDPAPHRRAYEQGGAAALSVLTDENFFQGSLADLEAARPPSPCPSCAKTSPSPPHILEAAAHGADAILLIAAILTETQIRDFREAAARYAWPRWWKSTTARELDTAIAAGSRHHRRQQPRSHHLRGHARDLAAPGRAHARRRGAGERERHSRRARYRHAARRRVTRRFWWASI